MPESTLCFSLRFLWCRKKSRHCRDLHPGRLQRFGSDRRCLRPGLLCFGAGRPRSLGCSRSRLALCPGLGAGGAVCRLLCVCCCCRAWTSAGRAGLEGFARRWGGTLGIERHRSSRFLRNNWVRPRNYDGLNILRET